MRGTASNVYGGSLRYWSLTTDPTLTFTPTNTRKAGNSSTFGADHEVPGGGRHPSPNGRRVRANGVVVPSDIAPYSRSLGRIRGQPDATGYLSSPRYDLDYG